MNKKGQFGFVLTLIMAVILIWVWAIIVPDAVAPNIDTTLTATSGAAHADGIGFFLRMVPWLVPIILLIGFVWTGASR